MTKVRKYIWIATLAAVALTGNSVFAQQSDAPGAVAPERQSVFDRPRPGYDALGAHMGSFYLLPSLDVLETYDSNIFAGAHDAKSDFYTTLRPGIALRSDWSNHALNFTASGDFKRYADHVSENNDNFATSLQGQLDILRDVYLTAGGGYRLLHEDRSSPDAAATARPVEYHVASGNLGFAHERGVVGFRLDTTVDSYSYNDATSGAGAPIVENDRNRTEYTAAPRVSYEIVRGYEAFVRTTFNARDYESPDHATGTRRDSKGYAIDTGAAIDVTHVINGDVYASYVEQDYDDARLPTASGFGFGANLLWNVTQLTSLRLSARNSVEETTQAQASGYIQNALTFTVEHELLRNVLLSAQANYSNQDYQGISRSDDVYGAGVGVKYLLTRNLSARLDVTYSQRASDAADSDYRRLLTIAGIKLQF